MTPAGAPLTDLIALARSYRHDAPCDETLLTALAQAIEARRLPDDPSPPKVSGLRVRREGLPEWWTRHDNLLLAAPGVNVALANGCGLQSSEGNVCALGTDVCIRELAFPDVGGLIVLGDRARLAHVDICASFGGSVLIGEETTASLHARLDGRNGGAVVVGADGMWSGGVNMATDDMHAIRDEETGRRINGYGGRIVIGAHVWLCEQARVAAGAHIGADTVVGLGSTVGNTTLPPNSVCVGSPCRAIRTGTTWSREDLP